jgi:restriction system protein
MVPTDFTSQILAAILPWIVLAGLFSVLIAAFKAFLLPQLKGSLGEVSINSLIGRRLDRDAYHLIPNVTLPTKDGTTQIDHVIVSRYGIFVIETKTHKGWIYGSERDAKWTQVIYKRKERFQNPLRQNYRHTKTLSDLTGIPHDYFKSVVVFVGDSTFKTDMPANVVHIRDFVRHIKTYLTPIIQDAQVPDITAVIQEWAGTVSDEQRRQHVRNLRNNRRPVSLNTGSPACPRCGQTMVQRKNRKTSEEFWGCPGYPKCRGTRQAA